MKKILTAGILSAAWLAAPAMATPVYGTSLQTQLDALGTSIDVNADQYHPDERWTVGGLGAGWSRILFELAGFANENVFGIYDVTNPTNRLTVFTGPDNAGSLGYLMLNPGNEYCAGEFLVTHNCATFGSGMFGFFLSTPQGHTFYSEIGLNGDGFDHVVAYQGGPGRGTVLGQPWLANEFILAWEDLYGGGDRDYDDFAVMVEFIVGVSDPSVPEPETLTFFGLALLLGGVSLTRRGRA